MGWRYLNYLYAFIPGSLFSEHNACGRRHGILYNPILPVWQEVLLDTRGRSQFQIWVFTVIEHGSVLDQHGIGLNFCSPLTMIRSRRIVEKLPIALADTRLNWKGAVLG